MERRNAVVGVVAVWALAMSVPLLAGSAFDPGTTSSGRVNPYIAGDVSVAAWSSRCNLPGTPQDEPIDPIKDPGVPAGHTHVFAAPTTRVTNNETPGQLLNAPKSDIYCVGPTIPTGVSGGCSRMATIDGQNVATICDRSAYWSPDLVLNPNTTNWTGGTVYPATLINSYFRNEYSDPTSAVTFPTDYAAIGGNAMFMAGGLQSGQHPYIVNFQCVDDSTDPKVEVPGLNSPTIPSSCKIEADQSTCTVAGSDCDVSFDHKLYLKMTITFPECVKIAPQQNGMETPTASYYAMTGGGSWNYPGTTPGPSQLTHCPDSSWTQIPPIQVAVHWLLNPSGSEPFPATYGTEGTHSLHYAQFDLSGAWLTSDITMNHSMLATNGPYVIAGATGHADFMNGFKAADIAALLQTCFHTAEGSHTYLGQNCGRIGGSGN